MLLYIYIYFILNDYYILVYKLNIFLNNIIIKYISIYKSIYLTI